MYFPQDEGSMFRQNFDKHLSDDTVSHANNLSSIVGRHVPRKRNIAKNYLLCIFLCNGLCRLVLTNSQTFLIKLENYRLIHVSAANHKHFFNRPKI
jgi:hypothetical protein